jgi:hypothetical protein
MIWSGIHFSLLFCGLMDLIFWYLESCRLLPSTFFLLKKKKKLKFYFIYLFNFLGVLVLLAAAASVNNHFPFYLVIYFPIWL